MVIEPIEGPKKETGQPGGFNGEAGAQSRVHQPGPVTTIKTLLDALHHGLHLRLDDGVDAQVGVGVFVHRSPARGRGAIGPAGGSAVVGAGGVVVAGLGHLTVRLDRRHHLAVELGIACHTRGTKASGERGR